MYEVGDLEKPGEVDMETERTDIVLDARLKLQQCFNATDADSVEQDNQEVERGEKSKRYCEAISR